MALKGFIEVTDQNHLSTIIPVDNISYIQASEPEDDFFGAYITLRDSFSSDGDLMPITQFLGRALQYSADLNTRGGSEKDPWIKRVFRHLIPLE